MGAFLAGIGMGGMIVALVQGSLWALIVFLAVFIVSFCFDN